jgi:protein arginine kinase
MSNWYLQSGNDSDVVLSSRVRLARNIEGFPFIGRYSKEDSNKVIEVTKQAIDNLGYGLRQVGLKHIDDITKLSLMEKHIISPEFALNKDEIGRIGINDDENICIMVNEEDHIRIQLLSAGLDLQNLLNLAVEIDKRLGETIKYAYREKYGFLTSCPTNCGTGLKASSMVHLPALSSTGNIRKVLEVVDRFGMNIRGVYGEGTKAKGNRFQISNKQTLGISEINTIKNLKAITDKVIEQERLARNILTKNGLELEDKVYRAYGVFTSCKKISYEECDMLLSQIRLGTDLGIIKELTDLKVNKIETYTKPANLQKYLGKTLNSIDRDIKRAEIIKQIINE